MTPTKPSKERVIYKVVKNPIGYQYSKGQILYRDDNGQWYFTGGVRYGRKQEACGIHFNKLHEKMLKRGELVKAQSNPKTNNTKQGGKV
ncbi:MAG: hypothetical protein ABIJ18_01490 [archaeon]